MKPTHLLQTAVVSLFISFPGGTAAAAHTGGPLAAKVEQALELLHHSACVHGIVAFVVYNATTTETPAESIADRSVIPAATVTTFTIGAGLFNMLANSNR